jgi:hypothetical protein
VSARGPDLPRSRSLHFPRSASFLLELDPTAARPWPALPVCPTPRPSSLKDAIVRWLEQEL